MNWFIKIPGIEINQWAPNFNWERLFKLWQNSGISGIVVPVSLNDQLNGFFDRVQTLCEMAKKRDLKSWIIFPVLNNPVFYFRYPESRPVHRQKEKFSLPNWFAPICPSNENYQIFFIESVNNLLKKISFDALLLDYLRIPYFWEEWGNEIKDKQWPPYCYCDSCKQKFEEDVQKSFQEAEYMDWIDWQGNLLNNWLEIIYKSIVASNPYTRIGVQILPLNSDKNSKLYSEWIGQNLYHLQKNAHFLSPLVYDRLLNWNEDAIMSFLVNLMTEQRLTVVPSFQISKIKWDRKKESSTKLSHLVGRMKPLKIEEATIFHARELLSEKDIRSYLG